MKHEIIQKLHKSFDQSAQKTEGSLEFWFARDLQVLLGYDQWKNFQKVIERAKIACEISGNSVENHFLPEPVKRSIKQEPFLLKLKLSIAVKGRKE